MNQYGTIAHDHWKKHLPKRFGQIPDPQTFFGNLGQEIEARVEEVSQALAGSDPPGEDYLAKLGRLRMAKRNAESQVLQEMALLDPATDTTD